MGGIGSGRWNLHNKKIAVEQCLVLDIGQLKRSGLISNRGSSGTIKFGGSEEGRLIETIRFVLFFGGDKPIFHFFFKVLDFEGRERAVQQQVPLQITKPYFGGVRYWFTCPIRSEVKSCNGRVGKLYLPPNAHYFACRNCHGLTYRSCQESDKRISFLKRNPEIIHAALEGGCRSLSELRLIEKAMNWFHRKGLSVTEAVREKEC